jgi:hypothetical protein
MCGSQTKIQSLESEQKRERACERERARERERERQRERERERERERGICYLRIPLSNDTKDQEKKHVVTKIFNVPQTIGA